jgi:DNA repair exonuclease SbcCD ATPase subunit
MRIALFALCFVFIAGPAAAAQTELAAEYRRVVDKRQELERKRQEYEASLASLSSQIRSLNMVFFQCVSLKEKDFWEARINEANAAKDRLEAERKTLADLRKRIDAARKALEQRRRNIEASHVRKGPGTPYETEFRDYMAALESDYFQPLQNQLFEGYERYRRDVRSYIDLLKDSVGRCMKRDGG